MSVVNVPSGALAILDLSDIPEDTVEALRLRGGLSVAFLDPGEYRLRRLPGGVDVSRRSLALGLKRGAIRLGVLAIVGALVGVALFRLPDMETPPTEYFATTGEHIIVRGAHVERIDPPAARDPRISELPLGAEFPEVPPLAASPVVWPP